MLVTNSKINIDVKLVNKHALEHRNCPVRYLVRQLANENTSISSRLEQSLNSIII